MKKIFYPLLMGIISVSCSKPADDTLKMFTDKIAGSYECKSITISGDPLDLNDDGIAGTDMIAEFNGFYLAALRISAPITITAASDYGQWKNIQLEIPKQCVHYDKSTSRYEIRDMATGEGMFIFFRYSIDGSGHIDVTPHNEANDTLGSEDDDMIYLVDYKGNSAKKLSFKQEGGFEALIDCTCYDFSTDRLVTVPALFVYEKTKKGQAL